MKGRGYMGIPDKRARILDFIRDFVDERGYAPTVGEIQKACRISSKSVVDYHLRVLEREGHIRREAEVTRGIEVSGMGRRALSVPLLGTIAAGQPIPVPTEDTWHSIALDMVDVPADLIPRGVQTYALKVKGTSMIDALIGDGDIVIMQATSTAEDGETVAAWLKDRGEVTMKKLYHELGRIRLEPANTLMEPIYCQLEDVEIQGKAVAILRKL